MPSSSRIFSLRHLCVLLLFLFIVVSSPDVTTAQKIKFEGTGRGFQVYTDDGQVFAPLPMVDGYRRSHSPNQILVKVFGLWGIIDGTGKMLVPPMYQDIHSIQGQRSRYAAKMQNYWYLIDDKGTFISNEPFENIDGDNIYKDATNKQYLFVQKGGLYGIIDTDGKEIFSPSFSGYSQNSQLYCADSTVWLQQNGLCGLIQLPKQELLPFRFDNISYTGDQRNITYVRKDGKWGVIDNTTGSARIPFQYEQCEFFYDSLLLLKKDGKWGIGSLSQSEPIVPCIYDNKPQKTWIMLSTTSLVSVRQNTKWGLIDLTGKQILPYMFDDKIEWCEFCAPDSAGKHDRYTTDRYTTKLNGNAIIINSKGERLSPLGYSQIRATSQDNWKYFEIFRDTNGSKELGLMTSSGTVIIEPQFSKIVNLAFHWALVQKNGKPGFALLNMQTGKILTDFVYDYPPYEKRVERITGDTFSAAGTITVISTNGNVGIIDTLGREIQPPIFEKVWMFKLLGSSLVKYPGENWSFLSATGELRQKERYSEVNYYIKFETLVKYNEKWGAINDSTGEEVIAPRYDSVEFLNAGFWKVLRDGKWFILNSATHKETALEDVGRGYDRFYKVSEFFAARKNGQWGVISNNPQDAERVIIPFQYDHLEIVSTFAIVRRGTKYGVIALSGRDKGKEVVPFDYEVLVPTEEEEIFDREKRALITEQFRMIGFKNGVEEFFNITIVDKNARSSGRYSK